MINHFLSIAEKAPNNNDDYDGKPDIDLFPDGLPGKSDSDVLKNDDTR